MVTDITYKKIFSKLSGIAVFMLLLAVVANTYAQTIVLDAAIQSGTVPNVAVAPIPSQYNQQVIVDKRMLIATLNLEKNYNFYPLGSNIWKAHLEVTIKAVDGSGNVLQSFPMDITIIPGTPERSFHIDYTAIETQVAHFESVVNNYNINDNNTLPGAVSETFVRSNIQFVLRKEDKLKYGTLNDAAAPIIIQQTAMQVIPGAANPSGERTQATFSWALPGGTQQYFEKYDLELLKVEPDKFNQVIVDWSRAATIEVEISTPATTYTYTSTLSEGTGYYFWRVRPVGSYYEDGRANHKNYGEWSQHQANGAVTGLYSSFSPQPVPALVNELNGSTPGTVTGNFFFFHQFDNDINWIYGRVFTEGARQSETMTFANGLNQVNQVQTKLFSEQTLLATQTAYDFSGRPALQSLPAPASSNNNKLGYRQGFFQKSGGSLYTSYEFDLDNGITTNANSTIRTIFNPEELVVNTTTGTPNHYYSSQNSASAYKYGNLVPDAKGFPYTRTLYYSDATGRVLQQGGAGQTMRLQANPAGHNITTLFGSSSQDEIDRIFGREGPLGNTVYKVVTIDPNKVSSVSYMAKAGQVLATALIDAGNPANLDDVGNEPSPPFTVTNVFDDGTMVPGENYSKTSKTLTVDAANTIVTLDYTISPGSFALVCESDICWTCDYKVVFSIRFPQDPADCSKNITFSFNIAPQQLSSCLASQTPLAFGTSPLSSAEMVVTQPCNTLASTLPLSVTLPVPGTYLIEKYVYVNNVDPLDPNGMTYLQQYIEDLRADRAENWTAADNCNCPLDVDPAGEGYNCNDPVACSTATEISDFAQVLFSSYITKEQNSAYKADLAGSGASLLSNGFTVTVLETIITDILNNTTGTYNLTCDAILNCFAAFGGYLDRNISLSSQTPLPSNFDPDFDYLKSVFNCLHYTYPSPGPGCEQYTTVIFNGVTGHDVAGNIRPWYLITDPATDNPVDVTGVLDIEVPNPNFTDGINNIVYTNKGYSQDTKDQLVRNLVCLAAYPYPNSLGLSQAESAKKVCECLSSHDPSGGELPDDLKDDIVKACEERCETRALSYETLMESYRDNYNNANNPDLTVKDLFDQSSLFIDDNAIEACLVEGLVNKCKSQCYIETVFSLCSEDLGVNPGDPGSYFNQTLGNEDFRQKMRDEQLAFQQAMLWNTELAPFKPSGGYSLFGDPLRVKKDVIYFIDTSLSNALNYKVENCTLGCTIAVQYPLALHSGTNISTLPATTFYKQQKFPFVLKIYNTGSGTYDNHSAVAVTTLVWEELAGSNLTIHEMNMGIYCDGNFTTPIVKWAYKPPTPCSFFTAPSAVQYDLRNQIVKFYTDIAGQLHAVMQPQACVSTGSVQMLNLTEKSYITSASFTVLSGTAGSKLMVEVGQGFATEYLYDNPVPWNTNAATTAADIAQAINGTYTTPNYYAEVTGTATVVIYASHITDQNPAGFSVITSGNISVSTLGTMALLTTPLETVIKNAPCSTVTDPMNGLCPYAMQKIEGMPFFNTTGVDKLAGELFKFWNRTIEEAIVHREVFPADQTQATVISGYPTSSYEYYQKKYMYFINSAYANPNNKSGTSNTSTVTVIWDKATKVIQLIDVLAEGGCGFSFGQVQLHLKLEPSIPALGLFPSFLFPPAQPMMGCIMDDLITWSYNNISGEVTATITDPNSNIISTTVTVNGINLVAPWGTLTSTPFFTNVYYFSNGANQSGLCRTINICEVCMRWVPPTQPDLEPVPALAPECQDLEAAYTDNQVGTQLDNCLEEKIALQVAAYNNGCLSNINDEFSISYQLAYHHYTLYYYDRANNLIKTVPPEGVAFVSPSDVQIYRSNPGAYPVADLYKVDPAHKMVTNYTYNSIKQLIDQITPDGNFNSTNNSVIPTRFWYNAVGQLVLSQDAQQAAVSPPKYSYTKYDALGRIIEVGELGNFTPTGFDGTAFVPSTPATFRQLVVELWTDKTFPDNVTGITKSEVVRTQYTIPENSISCHGLSQRNLRNRVSKVYTDDGFATYYSYDPHGNVEWLVQELPEIGRKTLRYEYDLVSGNVKKVIFNEDTKDQFIHRYTYDEDNRIRDAFTSTDGITWERETKYDYYLHGPLARAEIGDDKVQGCDYVYTIEGYLKSKNQVGLSPSKDPGQDGVNATSANAFAPDEFASELGYYHGDYDRTGTFIGAANPSVDPYLSASNGGMTSSANDLFNGNISYWMSNVWSGNDPAKAGNPMEMKMNIYRYDKLNRLKASDFKRFDNTLSQWTNDGSTYDENFTYDANGNIINLERFGYNNTATSQSYGNSADNYLFDNMLYRYNSGANRNNRLLYVDDRESDDATPTATYGTDIGDQAANNYVYDAEGNLVQDVSEGLLEIKWNVINKVASVKKQVDVSGIPNYFYLLFEYDAMGNRAVKKETEKTANISAAVSSLRVIKATYYVRDASGNPMAIYEKEYDATDNETTYTLTEFPIYGSSRVGEYKPQLVVATYNGYTDGSGGFFRKPTASELTKWLIPTTNGVQLADFSLSSTTSLGNVTDVNGQTGTKYNTAVQQDDEGNFLFGAYTQSDNLWHFLNKDLDVMMQSGSFTASANNAINASPVIVKDPSNASRYFFIYHTSGTGFRPLQYAVVDMAGDGGNGELTMAAIPVDQSGVLRFGMGLAVVRHPDGSSRILAYAKSADDSKYLLYSIDIDNTGLHAPLLRATLPNPGGLISNLNELSISPDGMKVALTLRNSDPIVPDIALWDYEPCCATFSNPILIQNDASGFGLETVHAEYTHGSKYLYFVQTFFPANASFLGRVNLNTNLTEAVSFFGFPSIGADVQRGPDCRLYVNPGSGSDLWAIGNAEDEDMGKLQFNYTAISAGANLSTDLPRQPVTTDHMMSRIEQYAIPELSNWIAATVIDISVNPASSGFVDVHFDGTTTPAVSNPFTMLASLSGLKNIAIAENEKGEIQFKYCVSYLLPGVGFAVSNTGNTELSGNGLLIMKGDHRTPSIISKAPEESPLYYIVTGLNGQIYYHTVNAEETYNGVQGKLMAVDQPLLLSGGNPLTYDATLNQYALAVYNDVTIPTANRLYVAVNQRSAIRLYEFPVTQAGIGQGTLVREYLDGFCLSFQFLFPPGPVQTTCFTQPAHRAQLYLCQMQISPAGDELSLALTHGSKGGLYNKIERFSINPGNSISLSFLSAKVLSQEPRTSMAPNGDAKPLLRSRLMSFDYSPTAKYIYYVEKKYPIGTYNTRLMRLELATGVIEQVKEYDAAELETEVRRAEDGKLYMNTLPYSALSSATPVSQLLCYGLLTTGTATAVAGSETVLALNSGHSNYGLPLQPWRRYARCETLTCKATYSQRDIGKRLLEMTDHLGNVRVVLSDKKEANLSTTPPTILSFYPDVEGWNDYGAFGSEIPGRSYNSPDYRYGFNGMEKDDEVKGSGNSYDFGARVYDPRLGRWLAKDPQAGKYPDLSPYNFVANNSIIAIDPNGEKIVIVEKKGFLGIGRKTVEYVPGKGYSGDNEFTKQVYKSLDYIYNNGADITDVIQQVSDDGRVIKIVHTNKLNATEFKTSLLLGKRIIYNPNEAMRIQDKNQQGLVGNFQSAAVGLFHEMGHAWRNLFMRKEQRKDSDVDPYGLDPSFPGYDSQYDSKEEKFVEENFETPAVIILQQKGYNESIRDNHLGSPIEVEDPTDIPIEDYRPPTENEQNAQSG